MNIIADDLEDKCRQIARDVKKQPLRDAPAALVGREIALMLDHMAIVRGRQRALIRRLKARELYIDSQIMNIDNRIDLLPDWLERTRLKNEFAQMLDQIENHTQRALVEGDTALRQLQVRLMELANMHGQLSLEHGDTEDIT